jgi:hypothetical protein
LFKAGLFLNLPLITIIITLEFSLTDSFQSSQSISPRLRQKLQMGKSSAERMGGPHTGRASTYSVLLRPKEEGVFSGGWNNDTLANRKRGMEDVQWIFFIPVENRSQSTIIV